MHQFTTSWATPGNAWYAQIVLFCTEGCSMSLIYKCILKQIFDHLCSLCHCPWQSAACSGAMCLLTTSWLMPGMLGLFYFAMGVAWGAEM
jgi:hypothetical protein